MAPASFSDDSSWDSAVISGGTLRPVCGEHRSRSALNIRDYDKRKRPSSKMSDNTHCNAGLNQFRRSLRLIGVPPPPRPEPAPVRPLVKAARPKIFTRVERRTVSTEDVRSAILDDNRSEAETASRGLVSRAVYEEWYFKKQQEAKAIREAKIQEEKEKRWKEENNKLEKEKKSKEKFEEWLKNKEDSKKNKKDDKKGPKRFAPNRTHGDKEAIEAAYLKWKEEKAKEAEAARKKEMEKKEAEEEKERKRIEAQKAFESWKKKAEEELKKQAAKEAAEERLKAEDKEKQKEERQKEADSCFRAWREAKDREIKERLAKERPTKADIHFQSSLRKYVYQEFIFEKFLDIIHVIK
ncbi:microtubule-associated protein 9-like [Halyomorpha halys]|uniref:microtubule-associated protein 9-like n=1 Tax=Halyomorpha halys TaxID=286706 RepID=UPI0006D505E9